MMRYKY